MDDHLAQLSRVKPGSLLKTHLHSLTLRIPSHFKSLQLRVKWSNHIMQFYLCLGALKDSPVPHQSRLSHNLLRWPLCRAESSLEVWQTAGASSIRVKLIQSSSTIWCSQLPEWDNVIRSLMKGKYILQMKCSSPAVADLTWEVLRWSSTGTGPLLGGGEVSHRLYHTCLPKSLTKSFSLLHGFEQRRDAGNV